MNRISQFAPLSGAAREDYFGDETRWQSWLDVEGALAQAQAEIGMIPAEAGAIIANNANLDAIDLGRLRAEMDRTMAPVFALSGCLAAACGEAGAYVHWGATTQNIIETGRLLVLKRVQSSILEKLAHVLTTLADQAEAHAGLVMVGRTNRQNALPITYGFKIAGWIDELMRVADQLCEIEPRLFQLRFGGAIGGYHSFGAEGQRMAEILAKRLDLAPSLVPNRTSVDPLINYISTLSMVGVAAARLSSEFYLLMSEEISEVSEALLDGVVGSSTMPQKVNPKHVVELNSSALLLRGKAAAAFAIPSPSHEGDTVVNRNLTVLTAETCMLAINVMEKLAATLCLVQPNPKRMQANFARSREMMATEGLMMKLAVHIGRGDAHDLIHGLVSTAFRTGRSLISVMHECDEIVRVIGVDGIDHALKFDDNIGHCKSIALESAHAGRSLAGRLTERLKAYVLK